MECTLSRDADLSTTITTPDAAAQIRKLRCMAGDTIHMAGLRPAEVEGCRLAQPVDVDAVVCAEHERILVINGKLSACTFAEPARFGPRALPAGTAVTYYVGTRARSSCCHGARRSTRSGSACRLEPRAVSAIARRRSSTSRSTGPPMS